VTETLTRQQRRAIQRAKRKARRPGNESADHWRLKRICRYIAWASGCWASAPEFSIGAAYAENNFRGVVDMLAIGKVRSTHEDILPGEIGYLDPTKFHWAQNHQPQHYLGLIAYECKASLADLRAGMVIVGAHKHYCVVPEALRDDALRLIPKHVGIITAGSGKRSRWSSRIARGARRRDDAIVPMWCYTKTHTVPPEWTRLLLSMAVCNTNYAVRWYS